MNNQNTVQELKRLFALKETHELDRMGALFNTERANYYYDTGTGKVLQLDDDVFFVLHNAFHNPSFTEADVKAAYCDQQNIESFLQLSIDEHLFRAIKPKRLYNPAFYEHLEESLATKAEQLILKLTDTCNFRCKYCIYNEDYAGNVDFSDKTMSWETAKKAVDYFYAHSFAANRNAVTFYGGEPLLQFPLLKQVVDYSRSLFKDRELSFSFTTNASLVTDAIADYLTGIPKMSIVCSLDGPQDIHNAYRKTVGKKGTFEAVMCGLEKLYKANLKNKQATISVNAVFAPPYSFEKLDKIEVFFLTHPYLSDTAQVTIGYPAEDSVPDKDALIRPILDNVKYRMRNQHYIDPLFNWQRLKLADKQTVFYKSISFSGLLQSLNAVNNRYITKKPEERYGFHGCCVPGVRRIYVETDGSFYPCERIGISPCIGTVDTGMDVEAIRRYYIDGYSDACIQRCAHCWAIRLCNFCYAKRMTKDDFNTASFKDCASKKEVLLHHLAFYHELMETESGRETLKALKDATFT